MQRFKVGKHYLRCAPVVLGVVSITGLRGVSCVLVGTTQDVSEHHAHWNPRPSEGIAVARSQWARMQWRSPLERTESGDRLQAGDGSVEQANSPAARGSWALELEDGTEIIGKVNIHREDISSTRCEIHALLAGLVVGQDEGHQICDNQSAIRVFNKARDFVRQGYTSVRYGDPHRMELRSLMQCMERTGELTVEWVHSHQEHRRTEDRGLQMKRDALARADMAAKRGHQEIMHSSYAGWIDFDAWCLVDEEKRVVMGNTLQYLEKSTLKTRGAEWRKKQFLKPEVRRTGCKDERAMLVPFRWDEVLCRFYWRARAGVLHTNTVKHLYDARWDPSCRVCDEGAMDTQWHRFGLTQSICNNADTLDRMLNTAYWGVQLELWLPDQALFPPGLGDYIAQHWTLPNRPLWKENGKQAMIWQPMVQIAADMWCHAQWLEWIGDPRLVDNRDGVISTIRRERTLLRVAPAGRMLPIDFVETVRELLNDQAGCYGMELLQWVPGWQQVKLAGHIPLHQFAGLRHLETASPVRGWWVDDIFTQHSEGWWEELEMSYNDEWGDDQVIRCGVYEGYPGSAIAESMGVEWIIRIPIGGLRMRTDQSVCQGNMASFSSVFTRNPCPIRIGLVRRECQGSIDYIRKANEMWASVLGCYHRPLSWMVQEYETHSVSCEGDHPILTTIPTSESRARNPQSAWWWVRNKLEMLHPLIYRAARGWRRFPTATEASAAWLRTLSTTTKGYHLLERAFFTRHWEALHSYWNLTCQISFTKTNEAGQTDLLEEINEGIKSRRIQHGKQPGAQVSRLITERESTLHQRAEQWHQQRHEGGVN